ncbi:MULTISPECIES: orange carotenoid protein N-terminal domain-containing protein [Fischerella]|uniref:Orange carotenoid protein n=1 Tax=Fischerella muscicola CCMEE 5323 TaxID=2019572 RepID=A0A2N6JZQ3_FISMU|nr:MULTISPECIES: orange carotenoid protein N-terminal domain-containing protein [Fischerella]MBD2432184.1 Orange carotenoid protein [Fischerella sp. FACHB-380]PLZ86943.1 Orange carotenoid protein [Fischerella muscicola CCMEE 5323]
MTFATDERTKKAVEQFRKFDVDTQLALLWFGYLDIKDQLIPANQTSAQDTAAALYDQIKALPEEQQLQAQRDIASRANSDISRAYTALSSSAKIDVWLRLAQGMEEGVVIQVPSDYKLPENTNDFVNTIKGLEFEQRVDFTRSIVMEMGAK